FGFFFSSRRRHTISKRDWSSDVCSSDLPVTVTHGTNQVVGTETQAILDGFAAELSSTGPPPRPALWDGCTAQRIARVLRQTLGRSEERRVGKEGRSGGGREA